MNCCLTLLSRQRRLEGGWTLTDFVTESARLLAVTSLVAGLSCASCPAGAAVPVSQHYTVVDRGPVLVRTLVNTPGLNSLGDLAIWHTTASSGMVGILYHGTQSTIIEDTASHSLVYPADVNDALTVTGSLQSPQDLRFTHAFRWSQDHLEILEALGGSYASATAINQSGVAVGSALAADSKRHAVLWKTSKPVDLGLFPRGDYSSARDINDQGDVVGDANLAPAAKPKAFLWHDGHMRQLLDLPGGSFCSAQAINDKDVVTGSCDLATGTTRAVIWSADHIRQLGTLGDDDDSPSTALDINSHAQVVGTSEVSDSKLRAFLWQDGKMLDLNRAIHPGTGWLLMVASRINDRGEIAGRGYYHGAIHAFLLRPDTNDRSGE